MTPTTDTRAAFRAALVQRGGGKGRGALTRGVRAFAREIDYHEDTIWRYLRGSLDPPKLVLRAAGVET